MLLKKLIDPPAQRKHGSVKIASIGARRLASRLDMLDQLRAGLASSSNRKVAFATGKMMIKRAPRNIRLSEYVRYTCCRVAFLTQ